MKTNNSGRKIWNQYINGLEKAKCNSMEKIKQIVHGSNKNTSVEPYKSPPGEPITVKNMVKDLGVFLTNDFMFKEHMKKIINSSKILI